MENRSDQKILWENLKTITYNDDPVQQIPSNLCINDTLVEGTESVINELNKHFANISDIIDDVNFKRLESHLNEKLSGKHFDIKFVSAFEVKQIIEKLDSQKSSGCDNIGANILKLCKDFISAPTSCILNNCISNGIFPADFKKANVTHIFKGGDKSDPNNYRPISILPTVSKIFERHVANQLKNFLEKTGVLYSHQSGFREKHSCQKALIHLINTWLRDIDKGNVIGSVFLDFRKAFDLVDHEILLHKLKMYHFSDNSCKLFGSYLKDRFQMVKHGTMVSGMKPVISGVPQGSILGPILFLLYVNDLPLNLSSRLDMYADDATLHKSSSCIRQINTTLQNDLLEVQKWYVNNNMVLNPNKTTCMLIETKNRLRKT